MRYGESKESEYTNEAFERILPIMTTVMHDESNFIKTEQLGSLICYSRFTACAQSSCMAACILSQALCGFVYCDSTKEMGWIQLEACRETVCFEISG